MCVVATVSPFSFSLFPYFFPLYMGQSLTSLPSFNNFAKISSHFFQHALYSFTESFDGSKGQEDEPPIMTEVVAKVQKEASSQGPGTCSSHSLLVFFVFSVLCHNLVHLADVDTGTKEPKLAITEEATGPHPNV